MVDKVIPQFEYCLERDQIAYDAFVDKYPVTKAHMQELFTEPESDSDHNKVIMRFITLQLTQNDAEAFEVMEAYMRVLRYKFFMQRDE